MIGAVQAVKGAMHRHQDGEVQATGQRVLDLLSGAAQQVQAQKDLEEEERMCGMDGCSSCVMITSCQLTM